jgi:hypothetical protein
VVAARIAQVHHRVSRLQAHRSTSLRRIPSACAG